MGNTRWSKRASKQNSCPWGSRARGGLFVRLIAVGKMLGTRLVLCSCQFALNIAPGWHDAIRISPVYVSIWPPPRNGALMHVVICVRVHVKKKNAEKWSGKPRIWSRSISCEGWSRFCIKIFRLSAVFELFSFSGSRWCCSREKTPTECFAGEKR